MKYKRPLAERFWGKVDVRGTNECWPWISTPHTGGYGAIKIDGINKQAHVVAFELIHGPIPDGFCICRSCDDRKCCNPSHLFVESRSDFFKRCRGRSNEKLDELMVHEIRAIEGRTLEMIAGQYAVSVSTVWRVRKHKAWVHVT